MSRLLVVDNPAGLPLAEDECWLERLRVNAGEGDGLILIGFSNDDAFAIRRSLAARLPPAAIVSVDAPMLEALGGSDSSLAQLAVARAAEGLACGTLAWLGHAGQAVRALARPEWPGDRREKRDRAEKERESPEQRPRLAFISPLPPEPTGIADYSAELLPYLAEHYAITLVVDQPRVAEAVGERFPIMDVDTFVQWVDDFDRLLYQVGNSRYHAYQFPLIRRYPGTVVLHDVYLFDALWWMQEKRLWPDGLRRELFADHGYPPLTELNAPPDREEGDTRGPEYCPVNGFVTREAAGLIVHSDFARELDRQWRPAAAREPASVIPHLRELPAPVTSMARQTARDALGIAQHTCLIASFGGINPKKLSDLLVAALLETELAQIEEVSLVLVGAQHTGGYGQRLDEQLRGHPLASRVIITGYVDRDEYCQWLQAADIAVQLRQASRGETSGAIFDAMAHGLAVVVNAHGSSRELPEQAVAMLPDQVEFNVLADCLVELAREGDRRRALGEAARRFVAERLEPQRVAADYRSAIEGFARVAQRHQDERWLDRLADCELLRRLDSEGLMEATRALCELDTTAPTQPPRILFDVSAIAWHDLKTGIERVTRRLADQLLRYPPPGWRVELIRWGGADFHLARGFAAEQLGIAPPAPDRPCEARPGDIYVSVEWAPPLLEQAGEALAAMRARGVRCYFTVHDLLPLRLPECFPADVPPRMRAWFEGISGLADGITTVSASVGEEVRHELATLAPATPPWVKHFHLGADFTPGGSTPPLAPEEQRALQAVGAAEGPLLLMVGTLEPRKGHVQVLAALERCWADGLDFTLCIVGKQGWSVDELVARLRRHPQRGKRLHWFEGAGDAQLEALYARASGLVAASWGEGFGLPLIEAAQHGVPLLARDIPVFREVAGPHASYFQADDAEALARALVDWRERWQAGELPDPHAVPWQSWAQSAEQWLGHILADLPAPSACQQPLPDTSTEARP